MKHVLDGISVAMCVMERVDVKVSSIQEYAPSKIVMAPHDKMPLSSKYLARGRSTAVERLGMHSAEGAADERPRGSWVKIYKPSLIGKVQTAAQGFRLFMDHKSTSLQAHKLEPEDVYH